MGVGYEFQSRARQRGHAVGKLRCAGLWNSRSQRRHLNTSGVMRRNVIAPRKAPTAIGIAIIARTSSHGVPVGSPIVNEGSRLRESPRRGGPPGR